MGRLTGFNSGITLSACAEVIIPHYPDDGGPLITTDITVPSGVTTPAISDVHIFVDESGNVTQIKKTSKTRLKYCPDTKLPQREFIDPCVIGVNDEEWGECSYGIGLGVGDILMPIAKYNL